jgi:hypothetical protein
MTMAVNDDNTFMAAVPGAVHFIVHRLRRERPFAFRETRRGLLYVSAVFARGPGCPRAVVAYAGKRDELAPPHSALD